MGIDDVVSINPDEELKKALEQGDGPLILRFFLATLSGATSAVGKTFGAHAGGAAGAQAGELAGSVAGGAISGVVGASSEKDQRRINEIIHIWLKTQADELEEIGKTMFEVMEKLDLEDDRVKERLESPEYLRLIKKCFRDWSAAESEEKRQLITQLLVNAAGTHITSDDIVNLFVTWIDSYSEGHFKVVRAVYNHAGCTRKDIWLRMNPDSSENGLPREDSPEADLFKLYVQDLAMGHIIRQHRPTDYMGNFIPQSRARRGSGSSFSYTSAFDETKQYELTQLGEQFVHYTMSEAVRKIGTTSSPTANSQSSPPSAQSPDENIIYLS